jgi:acetyl esterase/lipase
MKKLTGALLLLTALGYSQLSQAQLIPNPDFLDSASSHTYKSVDGVTLRLHVFQPHGDRSEPAPAMVFFFGGGWRQGSVGQFVPHAEHLSNLGMVAVIADYRVLFRHGSIVADALSDAKSAIRWVRSHADELGIDPQRIAAAGGSAGGHLAAATAAITGFDSDGEDLSVSSQPNALVLFNPAVNTGRIGDSRRAQFPGDAEALSPYHQVAGNFVPTLILHGHDDTTVPYSDAVDFCDKVTRLAGSCKLVGYEEATHGFFNKGRNNDRWYYPTVAEMDAFLTDLGYLNGH